MSMRRKLCRSISYRKTHALKTALSNLRRTGGGFSVAHRVYGTYGIATPVKRNFVGNYGYNAGVFVIAMDIYGC